MRKFSPTEKEYIRNLVKLKRTEDFMTKYPIDYLFNRFNSEGIVFDASDMNNPRFAFYRNENKFISKDKLPYAINKLYLGSHSFGCIDKLIKTITKISAPEVHNKFNTTSYFKVAVKNKATKKVIKGTSLKIKISNSKFTKYYIVKTDSKGMIKINTKNLEMGKYNVVITPANNKYYVSANSKIEIKA